MERRDFIIKTIKLAGGLSIACGAGFFFHNRKYGGTSVEQDLKVMPKLVAKAGSIISVATGEDPYMITKKAIEAYGGMQRYINRGDIVSLKPNIGWDRIPQQAANTNPLVIKALVEMCLQAGAKEVRVGDVPCVEANRSYQRSGIAQAAEEAGGKIIMPEERYMKEINIKGQFIKNWPVFVPLLEVDKIINVPIVKH